MHTRPHLFVVVLIVGIAPLVIDTNAHANEAAADRIDRASALDGAQRLFYNGRYEAAANATTGTCASEADDLAACELHTSALLFQVKRALGDLAEKDGRDAALKQCGGCARLIDSFLTATTQGQRRARGRLASNQSDDATLFYLAKLDLNYVWLQLGTLGRKTGWHEYWEARRSLDALLKRNPENIRARVARAWIDYIVDTQIPRGARWLLGGGNRRRGLLAVREAANSASDFFVQTEAAFALWDMEIRERNIADALITARGLLRNFPDNAELIAFIQNPIGSRQAVVASK